MRIRVFVVERHVALQRAMATLVANEPDLEICGVAGQSNDALPLILALRPDIVIIDVALQDNSGLELAQAIRTQVPEIAVVVFSLGTEPDLAVKALRAGALAFVSKAEEPASLLAAIRKIQAGQMRVGNEAVRASLSEAVEWIRRRGGPRQGSALSDVEQGLMALTAEGRATPEIATLLGISIAEVKRVRASVKRKLHCATAVDLIRLCVLATKGDATFTAAKSARASRLQEQMAELTTAVAKMEERREEIQRRREGASDPGMGEWDERLEVNELTLSALRRALGVTRLELEIELRAGRLENVAK